MLESSSKWGLLSEIQQLGKIPPPSSHLSKYIEGYRILKSLTQQQQQQQQQQHTTTTTPDPQLSAAQLLLHLSPPEGFVDLDKLFLDKKEKTQEKMTRKHPLLEPLLQQISKLSSLAEESEQEKIKEGIDLILASYDQFLADCCEQDEQEMAEMGKGEALLESYALPQPLLLPQAVARRLCSLDSFGGDEKLNTLGASAVAHEGTIYYKRALFNAIAPGNESLFNQFISLITIGGSPPTLLARLTNVIILQPFDESTIGHKDRNLLVTAMCDGLPARVVFQNDPALHARYPFVRERRTFLLQASKGVEGRNLDSVLSSNSNYSINPTSFTLQCIYALLFRLNDARADNYILSSNNSLSLIDADPLFESPVRSLSSGVDEIQLRSVLFLLPEMGLEMDKQAIEIFMSATRDVEHFLMDWLMSVERRNKEYLQQRETGFLSPQDMQELSLPISFSKLNLHILYQQIHNIQQLITSHPSSSSSPTHWDLFTSVYPLLSHCYQTITKEEKLPLINQQKLFERPSPLTIQALHPQLHLPPNTDFNSLLAKETFPPSPSLPIPALLQAWQESFPWQSGNTERAWIEQSLSLSQPSTLLLRQSALTNRDLAAILHRYSSLTEIVIENTLHLTGGGLIDILSENPSLCLTVGKACPLTVDNLVEIIILHRNTHRCCSFLVGNGKKIPVDFDRGGEGGGGVPRAELPFHLLSDNDTDLKRFEAMKKTGLECDVSSLGFDFLHQLAEKGDVPEGILLLLRCGFPFDVVNNRKEVPLHAAARAGRIANFPSLATPATINAKDLDGRTPLYVGVMAGSLEVVEELVKLGADIFVKTNENETLFHLAASVGHTSILAYLLKHPKAEEMIELGDSDGKTPLHRAVWGPPKPDVVSMLLVAKADSKAQNHYGYTPLHWAAKHGHLESARLLLRAGADFTVDNCNGQTPFQLGMNYGNDDVVSLFLSRSSSVATHGDIALPSLATDRREGDGFNRESDEECLMKALEEGRADLQIFFLEKIAASCEGKGDVRGMAIALNEALDIVTEHHQVVVPEYKKFLLSRLERCEMLLFHELFNAKTPANHRNYLHLGRDRLRNLRSNLYGKVKGGKGVVNIQREMSSIYVQQLRTIFKETVNLLANTSSSSSTPTSTSTSTSSSLTTMTSSVFDPKKYSILLFNQGEGGGGGGGPSSVFADLSFASSDVSFAILLKKKVESEVVETFLRSFAEFLHFRICNIFGPPFHLKFSVKGKRDRGGEEGGKGDAGAIKDAPPPFLSGYKLVLREKHQFDLIGTGESIACFQDSDWCSENGIPLPNIHLLQQFQVVSGSEAIADQYRTQAWKVFYSDQSNEIRRQNALSFFPKLLSPPPSAPISDPHHRPENLLIVFQKTLFVLLFAKKMQYESYQEGIELMWRKGHISRVAAHCLSSTYLPLLQSQMTKEFELSVEGEDNVKSEEVGSEEAGSVRGNATGSMNADERKKILSILASFQQMAQDFLRTGDADVLRSVTLLKGKKETLCEGWVIKKGAIVKNWKKRWMVLNTEALTYYEGNDHLQKEKGTIPICEMVSFSTEKPVLKSTNRSGRAETNPLHVLSVERVTGRLFLFQVESPEDFEAWKLALSSILPSSSSSSSSSPSSPTVSL